MRVRIATGRSRACAALVAVAIGGLLLVPATETLAAPSLSVSPTDPVIGETLKISGRLTTSIRRPVRLQYWTGAKWTVLERSTTSSEGRFRFRSRAVGRSRTFRVLAPKVPHAKRQTSATLKVRTREATAGLRLLPAPVGQSKSGTVDLTPARARFEPVRMGRKVLMQRRSDGQWNTIQRSVQDRFGSATFNVRARNARGNLFTYRAVAVRALGAPAVRSRAKRARTSQRVFSEEFRGGELDGMTWTHRYVGVRKVRAQCAEHSPTSVSVGRGYARLRVKPIKSTDPNYATDRECEYGQYYNAYIDTRDTFRFRYGIVAARIKFAHEDGQHSGVWSQPVPVPVVPGDPGASGAEIDIVEYFGDSFGANRGLHNVVQNSVYWTRHDGTLEKEGWARDRSAFLGQGRSWSNSFHVFSVQWTPSEYIFRIDGHETFRTDRGVSQTDQYVILSLLTSDWELPNLDVSKLNAMKVDWVRAWQP